ncbi:hypothetical protein ACN26P_003396 [Vibrio cholerae]|nr:hypothetical protein [Vibrio cholerae]
MFSDQFLSHVTQDGALLGYACELDFPDGISRAHSGVGSIVIAGETYLGVGDLGSVGTVEELADEKPGRVELELCGIPGSVMDSVMQAKCRGRSGKLFCLVWNNAGRLKFAEPMIIGTISNYAVKAGNTNRVSVTLSDKFELFDRAVGHRWSDESHQALYPDDRIGRYVVQTSEREVNWGNKKDAPPFKY